MTLPQWEISASKLALAIGCALAGITSLACKNWPKRRLQFCAMLFAFIFLVGVGLCLFFYRLLGEEMPQEQAIRLQDYWEFTFIGTMGALIVAITFSAIYVDQRSPRPSRFWNLCAAVAVAVVVVAVILILFR